MTEVELLAVLEHCIVAIQAPSPVMYSNLTYYSGTILVSTKQTHNYSVLHHMISILIEQHDHKWSNTTHWLLQMEELKLTGGSADGWMLY